MSAPTRLIPAQLITDLSSTLARLRRARASDDISGEAVAEARLNYLIDKIPREAKP